MAEALPEVSEVPPPSPTAAKRAGSDSDPRLVDGVDVLGALSPSRAGDFVSCPLLYRFRTVDRLPEPFSVDALRGTLVHKVLEDLFDLPAPDRTPERAHALVEPAWAWLLHDAPEVAELFAGEGTPPLAEWLASCRTALDRYFTLEDPRRLEPEQRELYVETLLDSKLLLRGIIDRVDVASDGAIRVVDYKSSRSPGPGFEWRALFQLKFYALCLWRERGVVPKMLRLIYLGDAQTVSYEPDEADLLATERKVQAIWEAITRAQESGDWRPRKSRLCNWCAHQAICPEFGGTPPPLPQPEGPAL